MEAPAARPYGSIQLIGEAPAFTHTYAHAGDGAIFCHAREELTRHLRQQCAGKNVIDIARAALYLFATPGNLVHYAILITEERVVALFYPVHNAAQLQLD